MPLHVAQIVTELLWKTGVHADEAKVLFLGWSYKANVGDPRETPALLIFESLKSKGITVGSWDPHMNYTKFPDEVIPIGSIEDARVMIQRYLLLLTRNALKLIGMLWPNI